MDEPAIKSTSSFSQFLSKKILIFSHIILICPNHITPPYIREGDNRMPNIQKWNPNPNYTGCNPNRLIPPAKMVEKHLTCPFQKKWSRNYVMTRVRQFFKALVFFLLTGDFVFLLRVPGMAWADRIFPSVRILISSIRAFPLLIYSLFCLSR